jgi:hypothetical protein
MEQPLSQGTGNTSDASGAHPALFVALLSAQAQPNHVSVELHERNHQ